MGSMTRVLFGLILAVSVLLHDSLAQDVDPTAFLQAAEALVEQEEVVGIEVLIEHRGHVLAHQAFGWKDREEGVPLQRGTIYNIRSMTKPMGGTLVAMLVEEGLLAFNDPVATYLPSFDNERSRTITIAQLLMHRGGYEQGRPGRSWTQYQRLRDIADYWGEAGPSLPLDGAWSYADAHADILGAVLEKITSRTAHHLLDTKLFAPLELGNTFTYLRPNEDRQKRIAPLYAGQKGAWTKRWVPADGAFYGFTMFSQSAYSTATDYARFMRLWMQCGNINGNQVLSCAAVKRAFAPREPIPLPPSLFPVMQGYTGTYGHMWGTAFDPEEPDADMPWVFMHTGSDGTAAYAFPGLDLIVIAMTQSRGTAALPILEQALRKTLVDSLVASQ